MSATLSRLILSMAVIASAPLVWVVAAIWLDRYASDSTAFLAADVVGAAYLFGTWTLVWAGHVDWTNHRRLMTVAAAGGSLIAGAVVYGFTRVVLDTYGADEVGLILGGMACGAVWLALTAIAWRETAAERAARLRRMGVGAVACPTCGYNLTGLSEARCPECGSRFTIDQLVAAAIDTRDQRDGAM